MQDITEQLANLEEDGKQYAHFLTHPQNPEYYAVLVREKTPEYVQLWLQQSNISEYKLALSVEMPDAAFVDYISELFTDQLDVRVLKKVYRIDDLNLKQANQLAESFPAWKQEKIRLHRVKWLEQFPWVVSTQIG
jgi:hypothetical protein